MLMLKRALLKLTAYLSMLLYVTACSTSQPSTPRIKNDHTQYISKRYVADDDISSAYHRQPQKLDDSPFARPQIANQAGSEPASSFSRESTEPALISLGIGSGIPYGIIGSNINFSINQTLDLMAGLGFGYGVGIRLHPSSASPKFRLLAYYGTNAVLDDPITDKLKRYEGMNIGIGYGSVSDGWDIDLIYRIVSDPVRERVEELEQAGYRTVSGDTDNSFKVSLGYHW